MMRASKFTNMEVTIRLHFDATSWQMLVDGPRFLDAVIDTFIRDDPRFKLHFNPVENWGVHKSEEIKYFACRQDLREAIDKLLMHVSDAGIGPNQVPQLIKGPKTGELGCAICYAARTNAFVIWADGTVSKCTVAFDDERNIIGRLTSDGQLVIDHDLHMPWLRGSVTGDASTLSCPAKGHIWPL